MMIKLSTILEAQHILAEALASDRLKSYQKSFNDKRMGLSYKGDEFSQEYAKRGFNSYYVNNQQLYDYVMQWNVPTKVYKSLFDYLNKEVPELNGLAWDKIKDEDVKPLKFTDKNGNVKKNSLVGKLVFWEDCDSNLIAVSYDSKLVMVVNTETVALPPAQHDMEDIINRKNNSYRSDDKKAILQDFLELQQKMVVYTPKTREMKLFPGGKSDLAHKQINSLCPGAAYYIDVDYIENNQDFDKAISREEWKIELNKQFNMAKLNVARYKIEIKKRAIDKNNISTEIDKMFVILTKYVRFVRNIVLNYINTDDEHFKEVAYAKHKNKIKSSYTSGLEYFVDSSTVHDVYKFLQKINRSMNLLLVCKQSVPKDMSDMSSIEIANKIKKFSDICMAYNNSINSITSDDFFVCDKTIYGKTMLESFAGMPKFNIDKKNYQYTIKGTNLSKISAPQV